MVSLRQMKCNGREIEVARNDMNINFICRMKEGTWIVSNQ